MARGIAQTVGLAAAIALLHPLEVAYAKPARPAPAAAAIRSTVPLAEGWRFKLEPAQTGPELADYDDSGWQAVRVPHTWNRVGYYIPDPQTHINRAETIDKTMGVGWYRLNFASPGALTGKRAWLQFDAASRIAEIWVNGIRIGEHKGGFSRFRFDVTSALKPSGQNLLAVRVDNSRPAPGATTADVLPLTGDFFVHGGLYRPASLIVTGDVHVTMRDHGGSGVRAETVSIAGGKAEVGVSARLRNDGTRPAAVTAVAKLLDRAGRVAARQSSNLVLPSGVDTEFKAALKVSSPRLWNGVKDPYLYTLDVEIRRADGTIIDRVSQPFGIRQMRIDPREGFFLNGKPYVLRGVGYHQDFEGKGWAIDAKDTEGDILALREMGATSIRLTHYQHGQPVHDLADRYGMVVWDEIPLVSQWTLGGAATPTEPLVQNARQQLQEMIAQNRNHASVVTWGIANEVDFGNSLPGFLTEASKVLPDPLPILNDLNSLAHSLDPSRPTALATCCEGRLFASGVEVPITAPAADLAGANRYFGWYYGKPGELGASMDALHAKRPEQPLSISEYGAGGATTVHTDNPEATPPDSRGRKQPEEVESLIHEVNWAELKDRKYLWATWLWSGFDFASTVRKEGDAEDINTKGLITFDRKIRKDAYFFYKANWSANPTVHITGRRYVNRAYPVTDVRIYSNAPQTELVVNGKTYGKLPACPNSVCVWKSVRLAAGSNTIMTRGRFAGRQVADRVIWQLGAESARAFRIDAGALVAGNSAEGQFGSDNFFVGGEAGSIDRPANYGRPQELTPVKNTPDRDIAATYRSGNFAYSVPLANGRYRVRLTFVEPARAPGERVFDVAADGATVLRGIDIAKDAGGTMNAVKRTFDATVTSGQLAIAFWPVKGDAIVSAIAIEPVP
ncbi:glycoside hydrolase family 2 TIM barrel-domain containing protein [Novosphingobium aquae]|uniref:Glycoside hydrolase family 2 TIM barrel-domain containing protein n=1 Tax=Novosphingobium aquae TaxID=3133435 RepID=A0ABU8SC99_9SPHN